jgi:hypothetical protein
MLLTTLNFMATLCLQRFKRCLAIVFITIGTYGLIVVLQMGCFQWSLTLNFGRKHQHQLQATCISTITIWTAKTGHSFQHLDSFLNSDSSHNHHSLLMKECLTQQTTTKTQMSFCTDNDMNLVINRLRLKLQSILTFLISRLHQVKKALLLIYTSLVFSRVGATRLQLKSGELEGLNRLTLWEFFIGK